MQMLAAFLLSADAQIHETVTTEGLALRSIVVLYFLQNTGISCAQKLVTTVALPSGSTSLQTQTLQYTVPCVNRYLVAHVARRHSKGLL